MLRFRLGPQQIKRILKLFLLGKLVKNTLYTCTSDYLQLSQVISKFSFQCPSEEEDYFAAGETEAQKLGETGKICWQCLALPEPGPKAQL